MCRIRQPVYLRRLFDDLAHLALKLFGIPKYEVLRKGRIDHAVSQSRLGFQVCFKYFASHTPKSYVRRHIKMEANKKIEIMIVGDSLIFRNGLRMLIETKSDFKVVGEAATISDALILLTNNHPNVIVVDSSQLFNGEAKEFLSVHCKEIKTLVLTNDDAVKTHQKYLLLGAKGVVTKKQSSEALFKAIRQVDSEELWFRRDVLTLTIEQLVHEKESSSTGGFVDKCSALTDRETEVLFSVCKGMKNKQIAESLFITETTVRHHLTSIFEKLSVKSRLELAIYAFNQGLVAVPPIEKSMAKHR